MFKHFPRRTKLPASSGSQPDTGGQVVTNVACDIRFPLIEPHVLDQYESYFILREKEEVNVRFRYYCELYKRPGLYEQIS